jgi:NAD+ synthase (glutamine-hydrolysing)
MSHPVAVPPFEFPDGSTIACMRFDSIYSHGFVRTAVCIPAVRVAEPRHNAAHTVELARRASDAKAAVELVPELGLSAYSNEDLFHQDALLDSTMRAVYEVVESSRDLIPVLVVGAPFNCALTIDRGRILGIS